MSQTLIAEEGIEVVQAIGAIDVPAADEDYTVDEKIIKSLKSTGVPLYLNGKKVTTESKFDVISPLTNEVCWQASSASEADVDAAILSAENAFKSWRKTKPRERRDIFHRAHGLLLKRQELCQKLSQTETGASDGMIGFEFGLAAELLLHTAGLISTIHGTIPVIEGDNSHAMVLQEPYGVILGIAPWNAPHILGLRACLAPLAAGNTVILKGPEFSPAVYHNFVDVLHEAGLPDGCLNTIYHRPSDAAKITSKLIDHPSIKKVNFTGSSMVGSIIAGRCGQRLKPCLMELGGKAPSIVCEDADLHLAAAMCAFGAFHHSGQICMATERIIVHKSVVEEFKTHLTKVMDGRAEQDPQAPVLVTGAPVTKNKKLLDDATSKGAKVIYGDAQSTESSKTRMRPVIIENITKEMDLYHTESFGPTVSLYVVDNDEEAITLANDTEYGLTSAVFTQDLRRGLKFAREIESGAVHINGPTIHDEAALAHGGVKGSGFGRFGGKDAMAEWVRTKTVTWQE